MIRAVTFDFWDTLVSEDLGTMRDLQIDAWTEVLARAQIDAPREELVEAFNENWLQFEQHWHANDGQWTPEDSTDHICDLLKVRGDEIRDQLVDTFRQVGETAPLVAAEGAAETLGALKEAGVAIGIVCDVGLTRGVTLRHRLEWFGLLEFFDAWAFSDETGWFKPAPQAFAPALEGLGIEDPSQAAHIGDSKRTDIAGALALGMTAIRFTGFHDRVEGVGPEAQHVISGFEQILGCLAL
ncbi:MAG: putative hydrolase of the superfamily [Actinomycetota bacterium]|nr:putative hydrolase of the superfamily [Actinomycetota bacterium]